MYSRLKPSKTIPRRDKMLRSADLLLETAEGLDIAVVYDSSLSECGVMHYTWGLILVNPYSVKELVMVLAHELGHYAHFLRNLGKSKQERAIREKYAYLYGWCFLQRLNTPITKREWREFHG